MLEKLAWAAIPLPVKLIGGAAVLGAISYGLLYYRASLIQKGMDQQKLIQIEDNRKALEKAQAQARAAIEAERAGVAAEKAAVAGARREVERLQASARADWRRKLDEIAARKVVDDATVCAIPPAERADAIRAELARNAARAAPQR
jgi:hypothetical protein